MRAYRNKFVIAAAILESAQSFQVKTKIIQEANLDWRNLERHLYELIDNNLLKEEENKYITTKRGKNFLDKYNEMIKYYEGK